jgi:methionyl-tRNA synthetase
MSKSVGNVLDPFQLLDQYGMDYLRYFLVAEVPFGNDGDFTHEAFTNRINSDLANDLGNLAQRALTMIEKHCEGKIPEHGPLTDEDEALLKAAEDALSVGKRIRRSWRTIRRSDNTPIEHYHVIIIIIIVV